MTGLWLRVPSASGRGSYVVRYGPRAGWRCSCPHDRFVVRRGCSASPCKHVRAARLALAEGLELVPGLEIRAQGSASTADEEVGPGEREGSARRAVRSRPPELHRGRE